LGQLRSGVLLARSRRPQSLSPGTTRPAGRRVESVNGWLVHNRPITCPEDTEPAVDSRPPFRLRRRGGRGTRTPSGVQPELPVIGRLRRACPLHPPASMVHSHDHASNPLFGTCRSLSVQVTQRRRTEPLGCSLAAAVTSAAYDREMPAAYRFLDRWVVPFPVERVYAAVGEPLAYPRWWSDVFLSAEGDPGPPAPGNSVAVVARG